MNQFIRSVEVEWSLASGVFFFQAEDGIRDVAVTGVQTCALPISVAMLHCGSNAKVDRPLAFDSAPVAGSMAGVGVAQTHGWVCEPSSTGPPIAWLVMVSEARRPLESARKSLRPGTMPVSTPRITRAV